MASTNNNPRNVLPDLIIPAMALAFAIYYLTTIQEVPWIAQASAVVVSGLLMLSVVAFAVRTALRIRSGREVISLSALSLDGSLTARRLGLLALTVAYVWLLETLGFVICTIAFLFLSIMLLSSITNWHRAALVSLSCAVVGYIIFIYIFETRFPKGPVEHFIEARLDGN